VARFEPTRSWLNGRTNEQFVRSLLRRVALGAAVDEETLTEAGMDAWSARMGNMTEEKARAVALRRAKRALRNPDIGNRFTDLFELGGFDITDAVKKQIDHIREGNYAALKDYWTMTQGPITKRVDIRVQNDSPPSREPRAITPRVLGPAVVEDTKREP